MALPRRALVIGLGLIGGSIGMALRSRGWHVAYIDPAVSEDAARAADAADERRTQIGGSSADLTVLATAVDTAAATLARRDLPGVVTSVCSVMSPLREIGAPHFVAGHPMAGSERRSLAAASADLFVSKRWFIDRADPLVETMILDCGGIAEVVEASVHDRAVAMTSHLPQVLSTALAAYLESSGSADLVRFGGGGLRTFLRLAASEASVWKPILAANGSEIAHDAKEVAALVEQILGGASDGVFERAREFKKRLDEFE